MLWLRFQSPWEPGWWLPVPLQSCHQQPGATRSLHTSLSPKQPSGFISAASLTSLLWCHPGSSWPAPSGELLPSILESGSENISRLFLCCYSSADEKEADLATSWSTNMFIGAHIPQLNTKLSGNLACCDLFKMWVSAWCHVVFFVPHISRSHGRAVALMASCFSLSGFGFGSKKGAEVSWRVLLTVPSFSDHLTQGEGDHESILCLSSDFTSLSPCFFQQTWRGFS